jgi:CTP:molybdopterin cytidylyltransferase MocA/ADP-ribose pyrophosphatase YjhB (NUDIX family)
VVDAVLLAAGASTRMGRPKLLLPLGGKSLVRRVAEEAVASRAGETVVVTGAYRDGIERALAGLPIRLAHNADYARGMSTSLRVGLSALRREADAAIIVLADQPLVDRSVLDALIDRYERSGAAIVQPSYAGEPGNPVLWDRTLFGELMAREGDQGGRELLRGRAGEVARVELATSGPGQDVDTPEEYEALRATFEGAEVAKLTHEHDDHAARFCPRCGGRLEQREVQRRRRPVCADCQSVFWIDPKVAVAALIPWGRGVLLGRRAIDPGLGLWSFPSGYVDRGEVLEEAARREVMEETGLDVDVTGLVGVYSTPDNPVILVAYAAEPRGDGAGGPLVARPGPEMSELADFEPGHLPPMAFSHDDRIVADWLALRRRQMEVA